MFEVAAWQWLVSLQKQEIFAPACRRCLLKSRGGLSCDDDTVTVYPRSSQICIIICSLNVCEDGRLIDQQFCIH